MFGITQNIHGRIWWLHYANCDRMKKRIRRVWCKRASAAWLFHRPDQAKVFAEGIHKDEVDPVYFIKEV